ncbi:GTP 3',8-cyclase MoaA [Anaerosinus massiliensis]|uniref:GTP 3',8-cyclase MoaA n=1 Tax=Massilibacillus massiliensis TaxID=1806837 RepID=UPI000AFC5428|nr:GTP 3',8-cyclase MoaA [Massilibacillus massiliensis]
MLDQFGRTIDYIRISVTDRCNLRCVYCMPAEGVEQFKCKDVLSYEEIIRLCRIFASLGIKKVKITGGEPLVRLDICKLIAEIKAVEGIEQVTITTNGVLLASMAEELIRSGVDGINISLDTVKKEKFKKLTRRDQLEKVMQGIYQLVKLKYDKIKINCVPIAQINGDQIAYIASFAKDYPIAVRFIELMPIGMATDYTAIDKTILRETISKAYGKLIPWDGKLGNGPANYFSIQGFKGKIGFIEAVHHKFCGQCNRVRLTANGFLKLCLQYDTGIDLRELLRNHTDDLVIKNSIEKNIFSKPLEHAFDCGTTAKTDQRKMFQVGG